MHSAPLLLVTRGVVKSKPPAVIAMVITFGFTGHNETIEVAVFDLVKVNFRDVRALPCGCMIIMLNPVGLC